MPHTRAFTGWGMTSSSIPGSESFDPVRFDLSIASLNLQQVLISDLQLLVYEALRFVCGLMLLV
jgi:hypothetical protein